MKSILKQRSRSSALWMTEGIDVDRPRNPWGSKLQLRHKMHRFNSALAAEELSWAIFFLFSAFLVVASVAGAQQPTPAPVTYTLKPTPKTVAWGYYDAKTPPALRVKSGDTIEIQTPIPPAPPQEGRRPIIYVKHLEPPLRYPPLGRAARLSGTIVMKLKIAADGTVESAESSPGDKGTGGFDILREDAEKIVKRWTFGCVGCPANAPFEHTIRFNYRLDDELAAPDRVVMNLPDDVTISTGTVVINPDTASSKKGTQ